MFNISCYFWGGKKLWNVSYRTGKIQNLMRIIILYTKTNGNTARKLTKKKLAETNISDDKRVAHNVQGYPK